MTLTPFEPIKSFKKSKSDDPGDTIRVITLSNCRRRHYAAIFTAWAVFLVSKLNLTGKGGEAPIYFCLRLVFCFHSVPEFKWFYCQCVLPVTMTMKVRRRLICLSDTKRNLLNRPWYEAETESCCILKKQLKTKASTTKHWHSYTSIISCWNIDASFWPGKSVNSQPLPEPSCQNTIPLAWHL